MVTLELTDAELRVVAALMTAGLPHHPQFGPVATGILQRILPLIGSRT